MFAIGDHILRARWQNDSGIDDFRRGIIADVYHGASDGLGNAIPLYTVTWEDNDRTERGYLAIGLLPAPLVIPTFSVLPLR